MPMPPYTVSCQSCGAPAEFKVAAGWSDGVTEELKTYSLCCGGCLGGQYRSALAKRAACRLAAGEELDAPAILEMAPGGGLVRRADLERGAS